MIFNDNSEIKQMGHTQKAGFRAPYWAAEIRETIDQILNESNDE